MFPGPSGIKSGVWLQNSARLLKNPLPKSRKTYAERNDGNGTDKVLPNGTANPPTPAKPCSPRKS